MCVCVSLVVGRGRGKGCLHANHPAVQPAGLLPSNPHVPHLQAPHSAPPPAALPPAECLPHDPLFDLLPPPGLAAAARRCLPKPHQVAAALAAAAEEAVALGRTIGAGMMDESTMAATLLPASMVPGTCCRNKRSADAPAPATQLAVPPQRRQQLEGGECGTVAAAAGVATPGTATPLQMPGLAMAGKRQRMLLLTAARGAAQGATPGSGVGSNSRVQPRAARRVARDLSFTPAPPQRQPEPGRHLAGEREVGESAGGVGGGTDGPCTAAYALTGKP